MSNRTVQTKKSILRKLSGSEMIVTDLIKQTSPDRSHVVSILRDLIKARLLQQIADPKHMQKKINKLTPLGFEYARFIIGMDHFRRSYSNFDKCIKKNLSGEEFRIFPSENDDGEIEGWGYFGVSDNKLKSRGWSKEEIRHYEDWCSGADSVLTWSHTNIILVLIYQYLLINRRDDITKSAKILLNEIIVDEIGLIFPILEEYILDYYPDDNNNKIAKSNLTKKLEMYNTIINVTSHIWKIYTHPSRLLDNRFLGKELKELLLSLVKLANPNSESLDIKVGLSLNEMLDLKNKTQKNN
jgi:DNA-binding MarR family transcriptional regulator